MKFTLSWLKDHLETEASLDEIVDTLTRIGLEVEDVKNPADDLGAFVVAKVLEAKQHPDADKLRVCTVEYGGKEPIQVVCGAPNARTGMVGVFAPVGTFVPGSDFTIGKAKIRGVESSGMLCSERELDISDEHEGIIELPEDKAEAVGQKFVEVMDLNDPMIEIYITPNRPDGLGVRGVARDLAAAGLGTLKPEKTGYADKGAFPCPIDVTLDFSDDTKDACPVFAARYIKGVKNGPSPEWLQNRLRAIGLRPINALADITNYVSYDRARPLHVFDADKLTGGIKARLAKDGETFVGLDGKDYTADASMTVIADDSGALGFGGIMGGESSGVSEDTTNVLIESAYFDPIRTAMTGRKSGIQSDARYRFERGIDPQSEELGLNLATELALEMCGGEPSEQTKAGAEPQPDVTIDFDPARVAQLTGLEVADDKIEKILHDLGFELSGSGSALKVKVPTWRPDIHGSADLVEEIVRIAGIDEVPATPMLNDGAVFAPVLTTMQKRVRTAKRALAARGMVEAITWSFITEDEATTFGGGSDALKLSNPISSEMSDMRPSLLPGLMAAGQRNRDRGTLDLALFEVGQCYRDDTPDGQWIAATGIRLGTAHADGAGRDWSGDRDAVTVFDAKADAASTLEALGLDTSRIQITRDAPNWFHPGRSGTFRLGPKVVLAHFGEVHPATLEELDVPGPVAAFEIDLSALPAAKKKATPTKPALELYDLQSVHRDFAFVMERTVEAADLIKSAQGADKNRITDVRVFDIYEGDKIGENEKSIAIEVTIQPKDKTLTDEQIEEISSSIIAKVEKSTGAKLRG